MLLAMPRDQDRNKKEKDKGNLREELEKESLEDIKPAKGAPDSLEEGEPSINDVTQKADKKKEEDDKEPHGFR